MLRQVCKALAGASPRLFQPTVEPAPFLVAFSFAALGFARRFVDMMTAARI
jgi:hypothetical protein